MIVDYYETSPRKIEDEFFDEAIIEEPVIEKKPKRRTKKNNENVQKVQTNARLETKKNINIIFEVCIFFAIFAVIGYRVFLINSSLKEKETLKAELAEIKKQNEQLEVNIEQQMNLNTIEQEAKEKLGMRKLDNNQKVYVNLNKEDFTESLIESQGEKTEETWWSKLLRDLFKIK